MAAAWVAEVPLAVVTVTLRPVPVTVRAGAATVIVLPEIVKLLDGTTVDPKLTAVATVKLVPVIVTLVPPAPVPDVGLRPVTAGAGT